jgi:hypothetical protein
MYQWQSQHAPSVPVVQAPEPVFISKVPDYLDVLVRKGFIIKINGLYNTARNPSSSGRKQAAKGADIPTACATIDSIGFPAPQKYWSVTVNDFVDGPATVMGAPTVEQLHIEECRGLLELRLAEGLSIPRNSWHVFMGKENIKKLLARPYSLAVVLGVEKLFEWTGGEDLQGKCNFLAPLPGLLEQWGYRIE